MKKWFNYLHRAKTFTFLLLVVYFPTLSCKKFLNEKPEQKIDTPAELGDLRGILDHYFVINSRSPVIGEVASDDYFLSDANWAAATDRDRNFYLWIKEDDIRADWIFPYQSILYANTVLDYLPVVKIRDDEKQESAVVKGGALFVRAFYHYQLAQLFAPVYQVPNATETPGIPLRLTSDINDLSKRFTLEETYESIIVDLKTAVELLPQKPVIKSRASKPAAYGLLSRTYLSMQKYDLAGLYADSCLQLYDSLLDYSKLNASASIPFQINNNEVIYDNRCVSASPLTRARSRVDTVLYNKYDNNDIRKTIFFLRNSDGYYSFKGNYSGVSTPAFFTGIATDEIYLNRAEWYARKGDVNKSLEDLNKLLSKRWKPGTFTPINISEPKELLSKILEERRKQLVSRTLRWTDLRRLNLEESFKKTLERKINGKEYRLQPASPRYVFQLSRDAIELGKLQQNP